MSITTGSYFLAGASQCGRDANEPGDNVVLIQVSVGFPGLQQEQNWILARKHSTSLFLGGCEVMGREPSLCRDGAGGTRVTKDLVLGIGMVCGEQ